MLTDQNDSEAIVTSDNIVNCLPFKENHLPGMSVEIKLQECAWQAKIVKCVWSDEINYAMNWIEVDDLNCCTACEM